MAIRITLTKKQVLAIFRAEVMPHVERGDKVAQRTAWNDYTDALCKERQITVWQCDNWINPF